MSTPTAVVKKFINDPGNVLAEALAGVAAAHPELRVDPVNRIIYRGGLTWQETLDMLRVQFTAGPAAEFLPFFEAGGKRGFVQERRMPPRVTLKLRSTSDEDEGRQLRAKAG